MTRDLALILFALFIGVLTGEGHIMRLSDHTGYYLVAVDAPPVPKDVAQPRRAFLIVVDGLRRDFAEKMHAAATIEAHGVCATTDVGPVTLSRPVYAVLSTGLGQNRTGSRTNALSAPLAADSIWQRARSAGFHVRGYSELPWWHELFPDGFDQYDAADAEADLFVRFDPTTLPEKSLTLIHPVYVDETAHEHGARSPEYLAAVTRVDHEIEGLLATIDWEKDLVVLTADHGHTLSGGHGGRQPELSSVLTCFGGALVQHGPRLQSFDMRSLAPALSVLLGIGFPRHMQASEDGLADLAMISGAAFAARASEIAVFRKKNLEALKAWGADSWHAHYASAQHGQWWRGGAALLLVVAFALWRMRLAAIWLFGLWALVVTTVAFERGAFDLTAINGQTRFIVATTTCAACVFIVFALVHRRMLRARSLQDDTRTALIATAMLALAHIAAYGWPIGYPLPNAELIFAPFVIAIALGVLIAAFIVIKRLDRAAIRR